ncbi:MAG: hypothetical protein R3A12_07875 [Ignavibacteria bacterium]
MKTLLINGKIRISKDNFNYAVGFDILILVKLLLPEIKTKRKKSKPILMKSEISE